MGELQFREMLPGDAVMLEMQPSQQLELGIEQPRYTFEDGEALSSEGAWTAFRGSRIVAIGGFSELFVAGSGEAVAWSTLAAGIGADHLALTRFVRSRIAAAPYRRVVAVVDQASRSACRWAKMVGLQVAWTFAGTDGNTYNLFERVSA